MHRHRLDRSRPLWEMWFLTGLPERRIGPFARMHHAIAAARSELQALCEPGSAGFRSLPP